MAGALVLTKTVNSLNVQLIRNLTRLETKQAELTQAVATFTAQLSILQASVVTAQLRLDQAELNLNNAIATQQPREVIVPLQSELIAATSNLVNAKTDLSVTTYKVTGAQKQLTLITEEIARNIIIAVPLADSGTNILVGQEIGLAEYTRLANPTSIYVALPSDLAGGTDADFLYDSARDGEILPKLAEEPYGWWYNTMVVPSAQIFRPRYWVADLLDKDDDTNLGVISYRTSADFGTRPFEQNKIIEPDVTFQYETTDSKSFVIGDLVLVKFDGVVPIIIGFATEDRPDIANLSRYKLITLNNGFGLRISFFPGIITAPPTASPSRVMNASGSGTRPDSDAFIKEVDDYSEGPILANAAGLGAVTIEGSTFSNVEQDAWFSFFGLNETYVDNGDSGQPVYVRNRASFTRRLQRVYHTFDINGNEVGTGTSVLSWKNIVSDNPENGTFKMKTELATISPVYLPTLTFDSGHYNFNQDIYALNQGETINLYNRIVNLSEGSIMYPDWLWDSSVWNITIDSDFFLQTENYHNYVTSNPGDPTGGVGIMISQLWIMVTPPIEDVVCIPVSDGGPQNLLPYSEDLAAVGVTLTRMTVVADQLRSPECIDADADVLLPDLGEDDVRYRRSGFALVIGQNYTYSAYVRRNAIPLIFFGTEVTSNVLTEFDLVEGSVSDEGSAVIASGVDDVGSGWYRIWLAFEATTLGAPFTVRIQTQEFTNPHTFDGITNLGLWGMQVNDGIVPTTYRKTDGTAIP